MSEDCRPTTSGRRLQEELVKAVDGKARPAAKWDGVSKCEGLCPVYIAVDRDQRELREQFLWKINADPEYTTSIAAQKFVSEVGLDTGYNKLVDEQIASGIYKFSQWKRARDDRLVVVEVEAEVGAKVFKDRLEWDLAEPQNKVATYASTVCADLGLSLEFYYKIVEDVTMKLTALKAAAAEVKEEEEADERPAKVYRVSAEGWGANVKAKGFAISLPGKK